ncbi:tetratricopeptide repeat protein [Lysinibacillus piscis]|uniref:DAC domain-containing protein n=1 Tax=Lysinibacillus piscis TaxID=2518931 RepID=A0ABQ5NPD8_9BACI|nr:tetratricopeptide repeat protein [Lysinibacillus sp. KH24]GLC90220.1 hypothetical protein LYSBPC_33470 [Lysinibacillus sp. KH24]
MNNFHELEVELEKLLELYIKEIDGTMKVNVEVLKDGKSEQLQEEVDEEKRSVLGESDIYSILEYHDTFQIEADDISIYIQVHGLPKNIIDYSKNGIKNQYVFIHFLLDYILKRINLIEYGIIVKKVKKLKTEDINIQLSYIVNKFFEKLVLTIQEGEQEEEPTNSLSLKHLDVISTMHYEGAKVNAKLIVINDSYKDTFIHFMVELHKPIPYTEYRKVRKMLELSGQDIFVIGNHQEIYGLGRLKQFYKAQKIEDKILVIDFLNTSYYKISSIDFVKKMIDSSHATIEDIRWTYEQQLIIGFKHKNLFLTDSEFPEKKLRRVLKNTFDTYDKEHKNELENMLEIVRLAANQKKGTMVVITEPSIAEAEMDRLSGQGMQINVLDFAKDVPNNDKALLIERLTSIDGAIYLDTECTCYAIGMILDGKAVADKGNSSRGARYNSAIRYQNLDNLKDRSVIVVISEDGMVDVIGDEIKLQEAIDDVKNLMVDKQYKEALAVLENLLTKYGSVLELDELKADILYELKEYDKALDALNQIVKDENDVQFYFKRGLINRKLQNYEGSIVDYTKVIELRPNYAVAYNNRGVAYDDLGKYDEALENYTKVIELNPNYAKAYNNRGIVYKKLEKYDEALEDYTKAIELNPNYARAYYNRGSIYDDLKEYDEALEDYTKAIELNPDDVDAYNNRGIVSRKLEKYDEALKDYAKAIELKPEDAGLYNNRGVVYKNLMKYDEALKDYTKAIELNPNYATTYNNRAYVHQKLGNNEAAALDRQKYNELK